MDYNVVFELAEISKIHYYGVAGACVGLFIISFSVFLGAFGTATHPSYLLILTSALFSIVFLYFAIQMSISTTQMLNEVYGNYKNGDVQVVEGTVEHCDTTFSYKKGRGSFDVNGIEFNYGHTTGIPGYHGKDNLIHSNGQQVRIHYITYSNKNLIVKIEFKNQ